MIDVIDNDFPLFFSAPPLPATCSESMKSQDEGATIVLGYCELTSPVYQLELQFQWRVRKENGEMVNITSEGRFEVSLDGLLTINDTLPSDSGLYQVTISNNHGSALHSVHLQVYQLTTPSTCKSLYLLAKAIMHDPELTNVKLKY